MADDMFAHLLTEVIYCPIGPISRGHKGNGLKDKTSAYVRRTAVVIFFLETDFYDPSVLSLRR